jgi:predicted RNase H-like HicB family nuclease
MNQIDLHILLEKEGELYSALCLELNVASQGETTEQAKKNILEAIELYLEDVIEAGDEIDFIPRPAPVEEWLKYFKVQAKNIKDVLLNIPHDGFKVHEAVYVS